jgi:hypothetical protein
MPAYQIVTTVARQVKVMSTASSASAVCITCVAVETPYRRNTAVTKPDANPVPLPPITLGINPMRCAYSKTDDRAYVARPAVASAEYAGAGWDPFDLRPQG